MKDYSKAKIYRIVCNITGEQYYGSTIQSLSIRKAKHLYKFKMWKAGKCYYTTSFKIIERGDYDIVLVENYSCNSKEELHARERYFIENNTCVNKFIPTRTRQEYTEDTKDTKKEYDKEYYKKNRAKTLERQKQYQEKHKDRIKDYKKQYSQKHKEVINVKRKEKYTCECGSVIRKDVKPRHFHTKKHKDYVEKQNTSV